MKKIIWYLLIIALPFTIVSCATRNLKTVNKVAIANPVATEIANSLKNTLSLSEEQTTQVDQVFVSYINQTNKIAKLKGKKKKYLKNISAINYSTLQSLNKVLNSNQYLRFINLNGARKPNAKDLFNNLYGGISMSKSAKNVLTGLLLNNYQKF